MLSKSIKYLSNKTLRPVMRLYLSKPRSYTYKGISLHIPPQVFHPAFFFSTKFLLEYLDRSDLNRQTFLELGAGSGLISLFAKTKGAIVTASDINSIAVQNLQKNSADNKISINIIHSDLFNDIPVQQFDMIAINPPYFKKHPATEAEYAWYCGENGEYFSKLFKQIKNYIHRDTRILMILSDGCDLDMIKRAAAKHDFELKLEKKKRAYWEMLFIYSIEYSAW